MRILVVDDDDSVRYFVVKLLIREGFRVDGINDGAELMESWEKLKPDVVVSNIVMPRKNGVEACTELKAIEPEAKIIFMTGSRFKADKVEASGLGPCLRKPFASEELIFQIHRI